MAELKQFRNIDGTNFLLFKPRYYQDKLASTEIYRDDA
jgi:hypothetical protein